MNERLLESILNIDMLTDELTHSVKDIFTFKIPHDHQITKSIIKHNYILMCSFEAELDIINSFSKENILIKDIMWSISPLLRLVKEYTGIKKGRNAYFAHYNRDRKDQFYPWWRSLHGVKLPRTIKEIVFLHSVFESIRAILKSQFITELEGLKRQYKSEVDDYFEYVKKQEDIAILKPDGIKDLVIEVDNRLKEKNIFIRVLI